jgi:hypothetical protein
MIFDDSNSVLATGGREGADSSTSASHKSDANKKTSGRYRLANAES